MTECRSIVKETGKSIYCVQTYKKKNGTIQLTFTNNKNNNGFVREN